jgi:hypothetical protein
MNTYTIRTQISWNQTLQDLADEFRLWGIDDWATNTPHGARWEGWRPQSELERTVRLTYYKNDKPVTLEMGKQARAVDNLRVLYLAIQAMRLNEKRGISEVIESAYLQLAAPGQQKSPHEVLGIMPNAPLEVAEAAYKARVRVAHPDVGGSEAQIKALNDAISKIRSQYGKNGG